MKVNDINASRHDRAGRIQTAARAQAYRNAFEWKRRAVRARATDPELAARLDEQVQLEIRAYKPYPFRV